MPKVAAFGCAKVRLRECERFAEKLETCPLVFGFARVYLGDNGTIPTLPNKVFEYLGDWFTSVARQQVFVKDSTLIHRS